MPVYRGSLHAFGSNYQIDCLISIFSFECHVDSLLQLFVCFSNVEKIVEAQMHKNQFEAISNDVSEFRFGIGFLFSRFIFDFFLMVASISVK